MRLIAFEFLRIVNVNRGESEWLPLGGNRCINGLIGALIYYLQRVIQQGIMVVFGITRSIQRYTDIFQK